MRIKINDVNEALKFSRIAEKFSEDIDVTDGRYIVNGKSHVGLLMIIASGKPLDAKIITEDMGVWATFRNQIEEFLVTGE